MIHLGHDLEWRWDIRLHLPSRVKRLVVEPLIERTPALHLELFRDTVTSGAEVIKEFSYEGFVKTPMRQNLLVVCNPLLIRPLIPGFKLDVLHDNEGLGVGMHQRNVL
ncbi:hypothetical protein D3C85_1671290 [compost metagenome]